MGQFSAEAEYVSASLATSEEIWLRMILEDVGDKQVEATPILCDNKSSIAMRKNPVYHSQQSTLPSNIISFRRPWRMMDSNQVLQDQKSSGGHLHQSASKGQELIFLRNVGYHTTNH